MISGKLSIKNANSDILLLEYLTHCWSLTLAIPVFTFLNNSHAAVYFIGCLSILKHNMINSRVLKLSAEVLVIHLSLELKAGVFH